MYKPYVTAKFRCCLNSDVYYQVQINGTRHVVSKCPIHKTRFHAYEKGLGLEVVMSDKFRKNKARITGEQERLI